MFFFIDEMKSFAKLTKLVSLKVDIFNVMAIILLNLLLTYPIMLWKWYIGLAIYLFIVFLTFILIGIYSIFLSFLYYHLINQFLLLKLF